MPGSTPTGPLRGLRVVDAVQTPDALRASTLLADAGADVLIVEPPDGHPARRVGPRKGSTSLLWKAIARNSRSVSFTGASAPDRFDGFIAGADILITEPHPQLPVGGRTVADLTRDHPHLIVVCTSPFGATGPLASHMGSGRLAEAFGGQTFAAGDPDRPPLHAGFPIGAAATALVGALGAVAAVLERDRSGVGQIVDVAGYEAVLRYMEFLPVFFQQTGFRNERAGNGSSYQVPVATWRTADDKWVTFSGNTNDIVHRLYRAMGRPDLVDDPRFATNEARVANRAVVEETLRTWAAGITRAELERTCGAENAPVGSVFTMADIFTDENYRARGSLTIVDDEELGAVRVPYVVPRFSDTTAGVDHLGPAAPLMDPSADDVWSSRPVAQPHTGAGAATPSTDDTSRGGPLAGLRVLDIGQILAGPFAATLLADLGADVVKVEKPDGGDDFRRQAPLHHGLSLWWKASARNKRSIALDLKDTTDRATFLELVAATDVITANFVPGTLERLGLGYDELRAVNPRVILVSVSGYGQDGPYRSRRAFGRNAEAYGGLASVTGYADGEPMPTGFPVADGLSATFGAFGALCVRYLQSRTPEAEGQVVDVALYETVFRVLEQAALVYDQFGDDPGRSSFGSAAGELICVAPSADGRWMSASRWSDGPVRFSAAEPHGAVDGRSRRAELDAIEAHIRSHTTDELLASPSHPDGFAIAPVASIDELLASPHGQARASIVTVADDELGELMLAAPVPRFSRTPGGIAHAAPRLDQHRDEILRSWTLDAATERA